MMGCGWCATSRMCGCASKRCCIGLVSVVAVCMLLWTGVRWHHAMQRGESVLQLACQRGYRDIVEACLDRGAPLDVAGVSGSDSLRL